MGFLLIVSTFISLKFDVRVSYLSSAIGPTYKGCDMADFGITAVRYNSSKTHIDYVQVRQDLPDAFGPPRTVSRAFVADLIRMGKASFQTWTMNTSTNKWNVGAHVHVIDGEYLTTDRNSTKRDNLGNLPQF